MRGEDTLRGEDTPAVALAQRTRVRKPRTPQGRPAIPSAAGRTTGSASPRRVHQIRRARPRRRFRCGSPPVAGRGRLRGISGCRAVARGIGLGHLSDGLFDRRSIRDVPSLLASCGNVTPHPEEIRLVGRIGERNRHATRLDSIDGPFSRLQHVRELDPERRRRTAQRRDSLLSPLSPLSGRAWATLSTLNLCPGRLFVSDSAWPSQPVRSGLGPPVRAASGPRASRPVALGPVALGSVASDPAASGSGTSRPGASVFDRERSG